MTPLLTWVDMAPSLAMAAALVLLPGLLVLFAGGMRGFWALAAAPPVSVVLVGGSAVLAPLVGQPWGLAPPLALTFVATVIALGFRWLRLRLPASHRHDFAPAGWAPWVAVALSLLLWARHLRNVLGRPDAFSQTFDNVWHLNAVHHMVVTGDASSLSIAHLNSSGGGFYPAAFHDLAALVTQLNGNHLTMAVNAVAAVVCAVVWPLGVQFLVRAAFRPSVATTVGIGVLAASFPAFPLLFLDFGILYANLLGLALLPVGAGIVAQMAGLGEDRWLDWPRGWILLVVTIPALLLSHPNAFMSLLMVSATLMVAVLWRQGNRLWRDRGDRAAWVRVGFAAFVIALAFYLWPLLRPGTSVDDWPAPLSTPAAVGHAVTNAPLHGMASWMVSLLMVIGIGVALRRRLVWMVGAWSVVVYFWLVISSFDSTEYRLELVGIWYNDSSRFAANLPLVALPLAALGVQGVLEWATRALGRLRSGERLASRPWFPWLLAGLVAVGLVLGTQRTASMNDAVERAKVLYQVRPDSPLLTSDEYALVMRLPELVPPDAVIANNPWNGSALAYALAGREVTAPHILYGETPLRDVVRDRLDEAGTDPSVCPLLREDHVTYALDMGTLGVHGAQNVYGGFDRLADAPGFEEVAREGDAVLYRITACG